MNENLISQNINGTDSVNTFNTFNSLSKNDSTTSTNYTKYKMNLHTQSLLEPSSKNNNSTINNRYSFNRDKDKSATFIENRKSNLESTILNGCIPTNESSTREEAEQSTYNALNDVNIYINSNQATSGMNNIHVHVYNYGTVINSKIPQMSPCTYESNDCDRANDDHLDSLYETPKRVSFANL